VMTASEENDAIEDRAREDSEAGTPQGHGEPATDAESPAQDTEAEDASVAQRSPEAEGIEESASVPQEGELAPSESDTPPTEEDVSGLQNADAAAPPAEGKVWTDIQKAIVESLIFASDKPIAAGKLAQIINELGDEGDNRLDARDVKDIIAALRSEYDAQGRPFQIEEIAEGFQMLTRPEYHQWVRSLLAHRQLSKLTPASIETLAIIAYKQPITRAKIDDIRGVQSGQMVRTLMERRLVKVVGREEVAGRPLIYGTTREFLDHFGLTSIKDLPTVKELHRPA
jgi:segregation and condensation protein B